MLQQTLPLISFPQKIYINDGGNSYQQDRYGQKFNENQICIAVFDGHGTGGHIASQTALDIFSLNPTMSFLKLFKNIEKACWMSLGSKTGGTTATILRINIITGVSEVANVGDSTIRVYDSDTLSGCNITQDHDTLNKDEFLRIHEQYPKTKFMFSNSDRHIYVPIKGTNNFKLNPLGGVIHNTSKEWAGYVVSPNNKKIALTRSIADFYMKECGLISEPFIQTILPPSLGVLRAIVIASDGLWDTLIDSEIREIVHHIDLIGNSDLASEALLAKAIKKGREIYGIMDNITLSVIYMYV
jgi:serine/threonine protein phosphatase PrpC